MHGSNSSIPPTVDTVVLSSAGSTSPPWIPVDGDDSSSNVDVGVDVLGSETNEDVAIPLPESTPMSVAPEIFSETMTGETLSSGASQKGRTPFLDPSSLIALGER
jgi:hypothetical protein